METTRQRSAFQRETNARLDADPKEWLHDDIRCSFPTQIIHIRTSIP